MNIISDRLLEIGSLVRIHESTRILHAHRIARIVASREIRSEIAHATRITFSYTVNPIWNDLFPQRVVTPFEVNGRVLEVIQAHQYRDTGWPVAAEALATLGMLFLPNPTEHLAALNRGASRCGGYNSVSAPTYHNYEAGIELFRRLDEILLTSPRVNNA